MAAGLACQRAPSADSVAGHVADDAQILSHFKMQDIQAGTQNVVLEADEGRMYDKPPVTRLVKPVVTFYKNRVMASTLKAPEGQILMNTHEIQAWGGVSVVTADSSTLTTDRMRYEPNKRRLFSDDPVRLEKPDSLTVGKGLEAEVDLSDVKIGHEKVIFKRSSKRS